MKLGEKIKQLRTEREMTQPELAAKAGIEQSYLSKLENDKGSPSFDIISRIAMALGTTALDLINSLSQSYIEDHLSHLPEVAAEYANIRLRQEIMQKRRFILSALAIVAGVGLSLCGYTSVFFPERAYDYRSAGTIREGEPDNLFEFAFPRQQPDFRNITATQETANDRIDIVYLVSYEYYGNSFTKNVSGGKRIFEEYSTRGVNRSENDLLLSIGLALLVAGLLNLAYSARFKPR